MAQTEDSSPRRSEASLESRRAALEQLQKRFRDAAAGRDLVAERIAERREEARREEEELQRWVRQVAKK
jgi:hypothetical protein